jgi:hypothetical protein
MNHRTDAYGQFDAPGHLDAINLMLRDLGVADHTLLHRAAFRGCTRELADLRNELIAYLRDRRERVRDGERD